MPPWGRGAARRGLGAGAGRRGAGRRGAGRRGLGGGGLGGGGLRGSGRCRRVRRRALCLNLQRKAHQQQGGGNMSNPGHERALREVPSLRAVFIAQPLMSGRNCGSSRAGAPAVPARLVQAAWRGLKAPMIAKNPPAT